MKGRNLRNELKLFFQEEEGVGVVEIILIIVVLIAVVALFKTKILELVETIFDTIDANAGDI